MSEKKSITGKQQQVVLLLLQGLSVRATAKAVGVTERTIARWKQDREFQGAYDRARQKTFDDSVAKLAGMVDMAVEQLRDILSGNTKGDHTILRACEIVLRESRATEEVAIRRMIEDLRTDLRE